MVETRLQYTCIDFEIYKCIGAPGVPQNIRAMRSTLSRDDCVILLQWDLPVDVNTSFLSHYIIGFEAGTLMIPPQFPVATLTIKNCNLNATIGIHAVDICGREGARTEVVLEDVLQETRNVTEPQNQTTTASQPDASTSMSKLLSQSFNVHVHLCTPLNFM